MVYKKSCSQLKICFLFHRKKYNPPLLEPPLSHMTSCTPTKPNSYFAIYLATVVSEPDLYRLLTFHVPFVMSHFHYLDHTKQSVQAQGTCICFATRSFLWCGVLCTSQKPKAGEPPLGGCPRLLIQYIRSYPPYLWPFPYQHPVYAPCCDDRDLLIVTLPTTKYDKT